MYLEKIISKKGSMKNIPIIAIVLILGTISLLWACEKEIDKEAISKLNFEGEYCFDRSREIHNYSYNNYCLSISNMNSDSIFLNFTNGFLPVLKAVRVNDQYNIIPFSQMEPMGGTGDAMSYYEGYCAKKDNGLDVFITREQRGHTLIYNLDAWDKPINGVAGTYIQEENKLIISKIDDLYYQFNLSTPNYHYDSLVAKPTCCENFIQGMLVEVHESINDTIEEVGFKCHPKYNKILLFVKRKNNDVILNDTIIFNL